MWPKVPGPSKHFPVPPKSLMLVNICSRRNQDFGKGDTLHWSSSWGSGPRPPPEAWEFKEICKKNSCEICQNALFSAIFQKIANPTLNFRAYGRKTQWSFTILRVVKSFMKIHSKIEMLAIFWNFDAKIAYRNKIILYNNFSHSAPMHDTYKKL